MRNYNSDISYSSIKILLKGHNIRRILAGQALNIITAALNSELCCKNPSTISLKPSSLPENTFVLYIRTALMNYERSSKYRSTLEAILALLSEYYGSPCCFPENIEITSNHPAIALASRNADGYASIESGGDITDFTYTVSEVCSPYTVELSFNFGGGNIVYQTDTNINTDSHTVNIPDLMNSFLGKQVNIVGSPRTIVANNVVPSGTEYNLRTLNGRSPLATVKVTNCLGIETTSTYKVEFEMKRISQMLLFKRLLGVTEANCGCAEVLGDIYPDRRGGGGRNPASPAGVLGDAYPSATIGTQNIFNTYFTGSSNAKWKTSDTWAALGGYHPNMSFRSPNTQVIDAFVTAGTPTDNGCMYVCLFMNTDIRADENGSYSPLVYFSSTACPAEPFTFGGNFPYSVNGYEFNKPLMQVGDVISLGSDTAVIQNVTTPAALGW